MVTQEYINSIEEQLGAAEAEIKRLGRFVKMFNGLTKTKEQYLADYRQALYTLLITPAIREYRRLRNELETLRGDALCVKGEESITARMVDLYDKMSADEKLASSFDFENAPTTKHVVSPPEWPASRLMAEDDDKVISRES